MTAGAKVFGEQKGGVKEGFSRRSFYGSCTTVHGLTEFCRAQLNAALRQATSNTWVLQSAIAPLSYPTRHMMWRVLLPCLLITLLWDVSGWDLTVMSWLANRHGFPFRGDWLLSRVFHDGGRQLVTLALLVLSLLAIKPVGPMRRFDRFERIEMFTGVALGAMMVSALKRLSTTSCPWDLQDFGGAAAYVSHWAWGLYDGGPGHCFPGGHASGAFAFVAVALPWLSQDNPDDRCMGGRILLVVVVVGGLFGLTQTLRGAHYPSHTLWAMTVCLLVAVINRMVFAWFRARSPRSRAVVICTEQE